RRARRDGDPVRGRGQAGDHLDILAGAALDRVAAVAGGPAEGIGVLVAVELVVAEPAGDVVVARPAVDGVVPRVAADRVGPGTAIEQVAERPAVDGVVAVAAVDRDGHRR